VSLTGRSSSPITPLLDELELDELEVDELEADELELDELDVDELELDELDADELELDEFEVDELELDELELDELELELDEPELDDTLFPPQDTNAKTITTIRKCDAICMKYICFTRIERSPRECGCNEAKRQSEEIENIQ
jgi:hypothetical protein